LELQACANSSKQEEAYRNNFQGPPGGAPGQGSDDFDPSKGPGGAGGPPPDGAGGPPPDGAGGPPEGAGPGQRSPLNILAVYTLDGGFANYKEKNLSSDQADTSLVLVKNGGNLNLASSKLEKRGNTSSRENSEFSGQNAALLVQQFSKLSLDQVQILSDAEGANLVFATGKDAEIEIKNSTLESRGNSSRGLDATLGGSIRADALSIKTQGEHSAGLATDRGGGNLLVSNSQVNTRGAGSPGIYSTGTIQATDSSFQSEGSEAAVIEGKNSISLSNSHLLSSKLRGVMLYQSFSGDATVGTSLFKMTGGSLEAKEGPLFYVTNTQAIVELENVELRGTGALIQVQQDRWGKKGSNGGSLQFNALKQSLAGSIEADSLSSIQLRLMKGSSLNGSINNANLYMDSTSHWTLTKDSSLGYLKLEVSDPESLGSCIDSQGHTLSYDASLSENSWLQGKSYTLQGGGKLVPR